MIPNIAVKAIDIGSIYPRSGGPSETVHGSFMESAWLKLALTSVKT